ncbi:hypothetical protein CKM354_000995600 [Cercospora kikuchii]|uniref:Heterokaryon incompatibility domain-containing protein n=1 Tax=Cercospora kikuchii TaxID=84275 RepID=A0A9P3FJG3_9PEZI|nr:uncharacterized protein CKM354_000995600 [Cercospora kikuchii]GIZ46847.1 hypothetical protein CKM354_000995600 [Cercospora kikuchii]
MRLLNVNSLEFAEFHGDNQPKYVIASHRWSDREATYKDVRNGQNKNKAGYKKVLAFARYIRERLSPLEWLWIDTCCINKESEAELSYSINSMFNWYRGSEMCLAYLEDIKDKERYLSSVWFTRGWTLQELIAPRLVVFVTNEWQVIGNKGCVFSHCDSMSSGANLVREIATLTGIPERVLNDWGTSVNLAIGDKIRWIEGRETLREEDMSYALFGIVGIRPGVNYGEGKDNARQRLLQAIKQRDDIRSPPPKLHNPVIEPQGSFLSKGSKNNAATFADGDPGDSSTAILEGRPYPTSSATLYQCLAKKDSCYCRCHSKVLKSPHRSRYIFTEMQGLQAIGQACNVETCTARIYGIKFRVAIFPSLLPFSITAGLQITDSWIPTLMLRPDRVCDYNGPGFRCLEKIESGRPPLKNIPENCYGQALDRYISRKVTSFKQLFTSGQASFEDVNPKGEGYLDLLLMRPWPPGMQNTQWKLLEFLMLGSPAIVLRNPRLLHRCAKWIGEGPHMDMLLSLLYFGLDPGCLDASLFQDWPQLCSPAWFAEQFAPDPMFIEFMQKCLQRQPGFGGCDYLSEALLTENDAEFERAIDCALRGEALRTLPNALGQTAVHLAVLSPSRLTMLLEAGVDPDCIDGGGSTPLMYAACYGASASAIVLLEHGADPSVKDRRNGRYFIDYAVRRRHLKFIEDVSVWLRAETGAAEAQNLLDRCLAFWFINTDDPSDTCVEKRLLGLGANANVLLWDQLTLMQLAKSENQTQLLKASGFTAINSRDKKGRTPLMNVASLFDFDTLSWMTGPEHKADVAACAHDGHTVMHYLFSSPRLHNWAVKDGEQAWHFTQRANMVSSLSVLLDRGASAFTTDNCDCACSDAGCTALTFALHKLKYLREWRSYQTSTGPMIELLALLARRISQQDLAMCCRAIQRFRDFEMHGYTHTCCRGQTEPRLGSPRLLSDQATYSTAKLEQIDFDTTLGTPVDESKALNYTDVIIKFAQLCFMYEQQPLDPWLPPTYLTVRSDESDEDDDDKSPFETTTNVDQGQDVKCRKTRDPTPQPRIYESHDHKNWLQWCSQNPNKLRVQGGSQAFVEHGLKLIASFEGEMQRLRAGD